MFKVFEDENKEYVNVNFKSLKMRDVLDLCKLINKFYKDGYTIDEDPAPKDCPKIPIVMNLKFIKSEGKAGINAETEIKLMQVEELKTVKDMLAFAKSHDIEIPKDMTHRKQIHKLIKESISKG